jgi:hypothetical protein
LAIETLEARQMLNAAPIAVDDHFTVPKGGGIAVTRGDLLANDSDPDGDHIAFVTVRATSESHGQVSMSDDYALYFDSEPGYTGPAVVEYVITDGRIQSVGRIRLLIDPTQDPVVGSDFRSMHQGEMLTIPAGSLLRNDSDPDGDALYVFAVTPTPETHGFVEFQDSAVRYTPHSNFVGTATFQYHVQDLRGGNGTGIVEVEVKPPVVLPGRVQGVGSLDGLERFFAFHVDSRRGQSPASGHLFYVDLEQRFAFQSTAINRLEISADGRRASFFGEGRFNGRAGYEFVVTIEDRSPLGERDIFRIQITGPNDFRYDSLEHAEEDGRIDRRGNIRIDPRRQRTLVGSSLARGLAFDEIGATVSATTSRTARNRLQQF